MSPVRTNKVDYSFTKTLPYSDHCTIARHLGLQLRAQNTDMEYFTHNRPVHSQHRHVHLGDVQVREGLAPYASSDGEMGVEQIHDSPRQRRSVIFPFVSSRLLSFPAGIVDALNNTSRSAPSFMVSST